jgi:hypothetical protein
MTNQNGNGKSGFPHSALRASVEMTAFEERMVH